MLFEIILAILIGILAGTLTGLLPGIHINLIAAILISSLAFFQTIPLIALAVFITSMAITHTFLDFIPSIYLGAPEEDSFLSILPGHQLLIEGKGHEAIVLTLYGSLTALLIALIFIPIFLYFLSPIFSAIKIIIPYILIFASLYLIFREEEFLPALTVFILAGFLGIITFKLPIKQPLLPLLTGLFGLSTLFISLKSKTTLPKQILAPIKKIKLSVKQIFKSSFAASLTAPLASFLPGLGAGQAAILASELTEHDTKAFLFLVGSINTIIMALSFITIYSIEKTRTGAAVAVKDILTTITPQNLIIIFITILISGTLSFFIGIQASKIFSLSLNKINYKTLSISIMLILLLINFIFSNILGIIILITATSLGAFSILSKVKRINLMGSLLIPTIVFYLTLN